ncbi:hypothetical protein QF018_005815, partial [Pseudomonas laurylsulfatiphila]
METAGLFIVFIPLKPVSFLFKKIVGVLGGLFAGKPAPTGECIPNVGAGLPPTRPEKSPIKYNRSTANKQPRGK